MKNRLLGAALAVVMAFAPGCSSNAAGGGNSASGSLGVSHDDALLYAADSDLDTLFVVDARTQAVVSEIAVGRQPEKVLVAPDGTVYVTNRLDRSVSVIRKGETAESTRIAVAVEPVGLAASTDGKTLYVVNATSLTDSDFGTLMAFDTATLNLEWEVPVGHEPRGLTLMGDGRAAISLYKQGDLVLVDLVGAKVEKSGTGLFNALNASALGIVTTTTGGAPSPEPFPGRTGIATARPMGLEAMTVSPDGKQLYVASLIATDTVLNTSTAGGIKEPIPGGGSSGYGGGSCGTTAVASPALLTFDGEGRPMVDDLTTCQGEGSAERPPMLLTSPIPEMPVQGPKAIALEATGRFLFIANQDSNNVAVIATSRSKDSTSFGANDVAPKFGLPTGSVAQLISVGSGPSGIAVSRDGKAAWVYNAFDHSISKLETVAGRVTNAGTTTLTTREALSPAAVAGRKLFFSATDARMNNPSTGISCATCHLEGREDGHVWNFSDGPRQTPSLQGRMTTRTAPFHWNGEFTDLLSFMTHTVTNRMGGSGVTPVMEQQVAAFIDSMPKADNPHSSTPIEVLARGRTAFEKAECGSCHQGESFTDNTFADVGTFVRTGLVVDDVSLLPHGGLNTPSLLGLARTAPYLHDGSALTLKARLLTGKGADLHGKTSLLSDGEVDDLVSYLKAL